MNAAEAAGAAGQGGVRAAAKVHRRQPPASRRGTLPPCCLRHGNVLIGVCGTQVFVGALEATAGQGGQSNARRAKAALALGSSIVGFARRLPSSARKGKPVLGAWGADGSVRALLKVREVLHPLMLSATESDAKACYAGHGAGERRRSGHRHAVQPPSRGHRRGPCRAQTTARTEMGDSLVRTGV